MSKIITQPVITESGSATGLSMEWEGGQIVIIVAEKGLVACGAIDVKVMDAFNAVVAVAKGTPQSPLKTPDDLLATKIVDATSKAKELGIAAGMKGEEALD
ncbi:MAG: DUF1805 domain-containing protein, partial [Deltaproteobacteria bacterium]